MYSNCWWCSSLLLAFDFLNPTRFEETIYLQKSKILSNWIWWLMLASCNASTALTLFYCCCWLCYCQTALACPVPSSSSSAMASFTGPSSLPSLPKNQSRPPVPLTLLYYPYHSWVVLHLVPRNMKELGSNQNIVVSIERVDEWWQLENTCLCLRILPTDSNV